MGQNKAVQVTGFSPQNINGDLFINNLVRDQAKGFIGFVGDSGEMRQGSAHATFKQNGIEGQAEGAIGIVSGPVATALLNSRR